MTNRHPNETTRSTKQAVTEDCTHQTMPDLFHENHRAGEMGEKLNAEPEHRSKPLTNQANRLEAELVAAWLFIAGVIIISVVAGYKFWARLSFPEP